MDKSRDQSENGTRHVFVAVSTKKYQSVTSFECYYLFIENNGVTLNIQLYLCSIVPFVRACVCVCARADVPEPPVDVELVSCESRVVHLSWRHVNENNSPLVQFVIEYNTSFRPDAWQVRADRYNVYIYL